MNPWFAAGTLDAWPLWLIGLSLTAAFFGASELGYAVYRRVGHQGRRAGSEDDTQVLNTALLLLALLLGFTFSMALERYEDRRRHVVDEAKAIATAWLRAGLIENVAARALQERLKTYAVTRIGSNDVDLEERRQQGETLRREIWLLTAAATAPDRDAPPSEWLVMAVGDVIAIGTSREATIDARLPVRLVTMLMLFSAVTTFLLGFVFGAIGQRNRVSSLVLFGLLALTILLILDLDRPVDGAIAVSQRAAIDLVEQLRRGAVPPGMASTPAP